MELKRGGAKNNNNHKPEGVRSVPFDIDLNETPVCSPRDIPAGSGVGGGMEKGKAVLFDINAIPSDGEGEEESGGLVNSGVHTVRDALIGISNNGSATCSNLYLVGNQFDHMNSSGSSTGIVRKDPPVDSVQQRLDCGRNLKEADLLSAFSARHGASSNAAHKLSLQNLSEMFLIALKEFIVDNHGILEDGWHVEFFYCQNRCRPFAVYCSPDGNKFESMSNVAYHLGLVPSGRSLAPGKRSDAVAWAQSKSPLHRRCMDSLIFSRTMDFNKYKENLRSSISGEFSLGAKVMNAGDCSFMNDVRAAQDRAEVTCDSLSCCKDGFPVQFEDFFILSVGKIDPRPSYHSSSQIWPVGYKSSWHDKITGSLFVCDVSDGGDSGPVFKVQRYPCFMQPIPTGSTILYRPGFGAYSKNNDRHFYMDNEEVNVRMIFADDSPPHLDSNISSDAGTVMNEDCSLQPVYDLQTNSNCTSLNCEKLSANCGTMTDDIGEFTMEGRSSSLVWRMVSQHLVRACQEMYKQSGVCSFSCMHGKYQKGPSCLGQDAVERTELKDSLSKFSHLYGPVNVLSGTESNYEYPNCSDALLKWLDQDRFGLDIEFVQEIIEQLPGVHVCAGYTFLNKRKDKSSPQIVGSGNLLATKKSDAQDEDKINGASGGFKRYRKQVVVNCPPTVFCLPGKPLSSNLPKDLIGDVLQSWELLWHFSEILGLEKHFSFQELEEELVDHSSVSSTSKVCGQNQSISIAAETESLMKYPKVSICEGERLTKAYCSLLEAVLAELKSRLVASEDDTVQSSEPRSKKRRKKEMKKGADNLAFAKKMMLEFLPVNELTWPELARRYVLIVSSIEGNLDSVDALGCESYKLIRCLQGSSGALCSSLPGDAGMGADALLLAEARKQIFGSSMTLKETISVDPNNPHPPNACKTVNVNDGEKTVNVNDGEIPEWAQVLEPVRKLPTNVGARIRKCIYAALDRNPPDWARRILEHSISKEVYKGNASGPTKRAVVGLLANVCGESQQLKHSRKRKNKDASSSTDVIMRRCQKVLRDALAADEEKIFCNILGRDLHSTDDDDDEGMLGFPSIVSHPLDFRTIDLRLACGAYGGSHEAFLEDVHEVWHHIYSAHADQPHLVRLAEMLSQNFETLYEREVLTLVHKLKNLSARKCHGSEAKKELEDNLENASEIPKVPWDEGICKVCGVDKDDDSVLLCDKCDSGYHTYCLNPPLVRIPEGNWYCPLCLPCHFSRSSSHLLQFFSQHGKKWRQGELSHGFSKALYQLGTTMEVKDYWEYSLEERILLLKFLGEEVLTCDNIRQYLDHCGRISFDLRQKLRSDLTKLKDWKFREELLAQRVAKIMRVLNVAGRSGVGGIATLLPNSDKLMGLPLSSSSSCLLPSSHLNSNDFPLCCRTNDVPRQPLWFNSNGVSFLHSTGNGDQFVEAPYSGDGMDTALISESSGSLSFLTSSIKDELSGQNGSLSVPQEEKHVPFRKYAASRNFINEAEVKKDSCSVLPICRLQHPLGPFGVCMGEAEPVQAMGMDSENLFSNSHGFVHPDVSELQACDLEEGSIKKEICVLRDSIACLESHLQKLSPRKDLLGTDSAGRLYWAFSRSGSSPWVVADCTAALQQKSNAEEHRSLFSNSLTFKSSTDGFSNSCPWLSFQSDAEIKGLIKWLRDNDPTRRELLESLLLQLNFSCKDFDDGINKVADMCQTISKPVNPDKAVNSNTLMTRAVVAIKKKYGPFMESDSTNTSFKWSQNGEATEKEKLHRCECLEPVWPSRHHCHSCHWSFPTRCELNEHNDGNCSSGVLASQKGKAASDVLKENTLAKTGQGQFSDDKTRASGKSSSNGHEISFGLTGSRKDSASSPCDIEQISAKFVTGSSNKELVKEIGLLGSDGIPSFAPAAYPYLSDLTLKVAPSMENEVSRSNRSMSMENQLQQSEQGNAVTSKGHHTDLRNSIINRTAHNVCKEAEKPERSSFMGEEGDQSSSKFGPPKLGNNNSTVIRDSSLRPLMGRGAQILRQLKINLLDMDAAVPEEALKPSKACWEKRCTWRAFVKSAKSVFEMVQASIVLVDMIKTDYMRREWCYWSPLSAAANIATLSALAVRIYSLDAAILYDKSPSSSCPEEAAEIGGNSGSNSLPHRDGANTDDPEPSSTPVPGSAGSVPTENGKPQKPGRKRKESGG